MKRIVILGGGTGGTLLANRLRRAYRPEDADIGNGQAHCMSMLLGSAGESIPVRDGELCLGTWQRVLFLELDRERDRRWIVQVVGT